MKSENHLGIAPVNDLNISKISFFCGLEIVKDQILKQGEVRDLKQCGHEHFGRTI